MALIVCPECGRQVSDVAVACPQCGRPIASASGSQAASPGDIAAAASYSWSTLSKPVRLVLAVLFLPITLFVFVFKAVLSIPVKPLRLTVLVLLILGLEVMFFLAQASSIQEQNPRMSQSAIAVQAAGMHLLILGFSSWLIYRSVLKRTYHERRDLAVQLAVWAFIVPPVGLARYANWRKETSRQRASSVKPLAARSSVDPPTALPPGPSVPRSTSVTVAKATVPATSAGGPTETAAGSVAVATTSPSIRGIGSGDSASTKTMASRFMIERAAFIAVAAVVLGPFAGGLISSDLPPVIAGITWVAMSLTVIFIVGKVLLGVGGFFEQVPADEQPPRFDWRRFAAEPLRLSGVVVAVSIVVIVIALARSCSVAAHG